MTVLHVSALVHAATALILTTPTSLLRASAHIIVSLVASGARDNPATGLLLEVVGDRVIDLAQLGVSVGVLAILVPLAESLVLKVTALLRLESLIDLAHFELRSGLLLLTTSWHHGLLLRLLLLHLLLLYELLLGLAWHGHLSGLRGLLLYYLLGVRRRDHLLLSGWVSRARDRYADGHGHLLGGAADHGIWHRGFKLLLVSCLLLLVLLLS